MNVTSDVTIADVVPDGDSTASAVKTVWVWPESVRRMSRASARLVGLPMIWPLMLTVVSAAMTTSPSRATAAALATASRST